MDDREMCEPYRWSDDLGRVRWQPQLGNQRLWSDRVSVKWHETDYLAWYGPKLYRWKWRARRCALKELRWRRKRFKPAEQQQTVDRDPEEVRKEFLRLVGQDSDGRLKSWVKKVLT